jgi:hypothetical protein
METQSLNIIQTLIASIAAIAAVVAIGISVWQLGVQREHNRISLKPLLDPYTDHSRNGDEMVFSYLLKNHGIGPATIETAVFENNGKEYPIHEGSTDKIEKLVKDVLGDQVQYQIERTTCFGPESVMPAGDERLLLKIRFPTWTEPYQAAVSKAVLETSFTVAYTSIYGETFKKHFKERGPIIDDEAPES